MGCNQQTVMIRDMVDETTGGKPRAFDKIHAGLMEALEYAKTDPMTHAEHLARRVETEEPSEELRDAVNAFNGWQKSPDGFRWIKGGEGRNWATMPDPLHVRDDAAEMMPPRWCVVIHELPNNGWTVAGFGVFIPKYRVDAKAPTEPRARTAAAIRAKGMGSE